MKRLLSILVLLLTALTVWSQAPGTTPVEVSLQTQMLHGRKYYVHIVKTGQTVYSIAKAYKVESYDAVTHTDIHFLHDGDTVWLPCRGQFSGAAQQIDPPEPEQKPAVPTVATTSAKRPTPATGEKSTRPATPPTVRKTGKTLKVALMMPLHLDQVDEISTSKFDIEQRGKKSYRQFEFIEFYEGILMALDRLAEEGLSVELNVVDVSDNTAAKVEETFVSHNVAQCDVLIALLLRDAFDRAAALAREAGIYIVNPMATRSEICDENPYMVKIQPSTEGLVKLMLKNMKAERPDGHLYIIHSSAKAEQALLNEVKRQLDEQGEIQYTLFNWSQNAKLATTLKNSPNCNVLCIYDQGKDPNRVMAGNLLNRLSAIKSNSPTLYTINDWTRDYSDMDFNQLQLLNYHTFATAWNMGNEVHVAFLKEFRDRFGSEPTSPLAATGYDLTIYLLRGLNRFGANFWSAPVVSTEGMTQPLRLVRKAAGLENERATLYRMDNLKLVPASLK